MKRSLVMSLVSAVVLVSHLSADQQVVWNTSKGSFQDNISIGAQLGGIAGIGLGANVKYKIDDQFGVRAGFDLFTLSNDTIKDLIDDEDDDSIASSVEEIELEDAELTIQDLNLFIDWHPWCGSFRTTAGLIVNNSEIKGTLKPKAGTKFEFNGYNFDVSDVGSIDVLTDFDPVAPYVGIGGDSSFAKDKGFGFTYDIGLIFQGAPKVSYTPHYARADVPDSVKKELEEAIDKEKKEVQDDLDDIKILPYVSIGFNYKF